jgi:hypothetical protein
VLLPRLRVPGPDRNALTNVVIEVKRVELQEVELRLHHLDRRREVMKRDINEVIQAVPVIARNRR